MHEFTYYRAGSAASHLQPTDIPGDYVARARVFHTSGITQAISASAAETAEVAINQARARNLIISYDANIRQQISRLKRYFSPQVAETILRSDDDSSFKAIGARSQWSSWICAGSPPFLTVLSPKRSWSC